MYEDNYDYIMHHGVKGMKWGVRRKYKSIRRKAAKIHKKSVDTQLESEKERSKNEGLKQTRAQYSDMKEFSKAIDKEIDKSSKKIDNLDNHDRKLTEKYDNLVDKGRNTGVTIKIHNKTESLKNALKNTDNYYDRYTTMTRKDEFDRHVSGIYGDKAKTYYKQRKKDKVNNYK